MHLTQLRLRDFRAFRQAEVGLGRAGLILIAGANNSGKSTLLAALHLVAGRGFPTDFRNVDGEAAEVVARFQLDDGERRALLAHHELEGRLAIGALDWVDFYFTEQGPGLVLSRVGTAWPGIPSGIDLAVWSGGNVWGETMLSSGGIGRPPSTNTSITGSTTDFLTLLRERASASSLALGLDEWRSRYYYFPSVRSGGPPTIRIDAVPDLNPTGDNLANVLLYIQHADPEMFAKVQELIKEVVPEVGTVETLLSRTDVSIVFRDPFAPNRTRNLQDLGEGVEQLMMAILVGLTRKPPFTVVMEEPETGLHPAAQRAMLGLMRDWSSDILYVAATHSSAMLDLGAATGNVLVVRRADGVSTVGPADEKLADAISALGARVSDVLIADRILLVEGPTDLELLRVWFPQLSRNPRIAVVPAGGGNAASLTPVFQRWLDDADRHAGRRFLFLRDRDELPSGQRDRLAQYPSVHVLQRRELENYLIEPAAICSVLAAHARGDAPTQDEVAIASSALADDLKESVVLRTMCWKLQGLAARIMDDETRGRLVRERAGLAELTISLSAKVTDLEAIKETLQSLWESTANDIASRWEAEKLSLAPGKELLDAIWNRFTGQGYDKRNDRLAIAREMGEPPSELRIVIERFLED